jgi:hypothetical protein
MKTIIISEGKKFSREKKQFSMIMLYIVAVCMHIEELVL